MPSENTRVMQQFTSAKTFWASTCMTSMLRRRIQKPLDLESYVGVRTATLIMEIIFMLWARNIAVILFIIISGCSNKNAFSEGICPNQINQPLRFVDVFDGNPEDLATLVPDQAEEQYGYWLLGYVYDATRFVTVRCKYADGKILDVKLFKRINRCNYKIDAKKTLSLDCK